MSNILGWWRHRRGGPPPVPHAPAPGAPVAAVDRPSSARNLSYNYLGTFSLMVLGFLTVPFLIRALGVEAFGILGLLSAIGAYAVLLDLGLGLAGMKLVAERSLEREADEVERLYANLLAAYVAMSAVLLGALLLFLPWAAVVFHISPDLAGDFRHAYLIATVSLSVGFSGAANSAVLQGLHDFKGVNYVVVVLSVGSTVCGLVVALATHSLVAVAAWNGIVTVVGWLLKAYLVRRKGLRLRWSNLSWATMRQIVTFGSGVFVVNVATRIIFETDTIVIGAVAGAAPVARYQVALNPTTALRRIGDQLNSVTLTASSHLHAQDRRRELQDLYVSASRYSVIIMLPPAMCATFLASDLLRTWIGPEFATSAPALIALTWAAFVVNVQSTSAQFLLTLRRHRSLAVCLSVEAAANLVLSVVLLARFGITGVAVGTLVPTLLTAAVYTVPRAARELGLTLRQVMAVGGKPLLAAVLALPVLLLARLGPPLHHLVEVLAIAALYSALYAGVLLAADRELRQIAARFVPITGVPR